ncbi:MAG TPA: hypothetical protein VFG23_25850 [Polyangia bacterium]|nr:hypothetical protein [Polyangia bacterium]
MGGVAVLGRGAEAPEASDALEVEPEWPFDAPDPETTPLELLERRLCDVERRDNPEALLRVPARVEPTLVEPVAGSFDPEPVFPESKIKGSVLPRPLLPVP